MGLGFSFSGAAGGKPLGVGTGMPAVAGAVAGAASAAGAGAAAAGHAAGALFAPPPSNIVPGSNAAQVAKNTTGFVPTGVAGPGQSGVPGAPGGLDYGAILQSDPGYAAAANNANLAEGEGAAARTAAIRQAAMQYGGFAPGVKDTYGDLDQATLEAAQANPYSAMAQQQHQEQITQNQDRAALAARGVLQSGDTPNTISTENYNNGKSLYDLANQFGGAVNSAIGNYTGVLDQNRTDLANAVATAEHNQDTNPAYLGAGTPTHPPGSTTGVHPSRQALTLPRFHPSAALRTPGRAAARVGSVASNALGAF